MHHRERFKLLGIYTTPRFKYGRKVNDLHRGESAIACRDLAHPPAFMRG